MRYQGRITKWKDDQGFGFITPNGGGEPIFVHIKTFSNRERRPVGNELVTYELTVDERRRPRAAKVAFVGERRVEPSRAGWAWVPFASLTTFLVALSGAVLLGKLPLAVLGAYFAASVVTFIAYAFDKSAAEKDRRRIRESTLHMFAFLGGWPGALLAQRVLHHKSKKREFQRVFWATVAANCGALLIYSSSSTSRALMTILRAAR